MTDIASGWTECAPIAVRDSALLVDTVERIRLTLPFKLRALDTDNGTEFINETLIQYCLTHGIELTRSRPWLKNDQAWIEQKNGSVVRRMLGLRRFEGLAAAQTMGRLYAALRFFVNFFQTSFKLADKQTRGSQVTRRYHAPATPCERLLGSPEMPEAIKERLRNVFDQLDPIRLLEEIRTMQGRLATMSDGGAVVMLDGAEPNLATFLSSLSAGWKDGDARPTHTEDVGYKRETKKPEETIACDNPPAEQPAVPLEVPNMPPVALLGRWQVGQNRSKKYKDVWPEILLWIEQRPNLTAGIILDLLAAARPGRFENTVAEQKYLGRRIRKWRAKAIARGVVIGKRLRRKGCRGGSRRQPMIEAGWPEMAQMLEADPDLTGVEILEEMCLQYPDKYDPNQLRTVQRRVKLWRRDAARRLVFNVGHPSLVQKVEGGAQPAPLKAEVPGPSLHTSHPQSPSALGNISRDATGNKIT
jgi:hypothetical protein